MSDDLERRFDQVSVLPTPEHDLTRVRSRRSRFRARRALLSTAVIATIAAVAVASVYFAPLGRDRSPRPVAGDELSVMQFAATAFPDEQLRDAVPDGFTLVRIVRHGPEETNHDYATVGVQMQGPVPYARAIFFVHRNTSAARELHDQILSRIPAPARRLQVSGGYCGRVCAISNAAPGATCGVDQSTFSCQARRGRVVLWVQSSASTSPAGIAAATEDEWDAATELTRSFSGVLIAAVDEEPKLEESLVRVETETVELGDQPSAVAAGGGSVWVTTGMRRELLEMRDGDIISRYEGGGREVAVEGGIVWQTRGGDGAEPDGEVIGVDASTGEVVQHLEFPAESPYGIAARGREVFIALYDGDLVLFDPENNPGTRTALGSGLTMRIALGSGLTNVLSAHGAVWVSQPGGQNPRVWRVTVGQDDSNAAPILLTPQGKGSCPQGLAATAEAVWVADPCAAALWQLDPSGRVVDRIESVGRKPVDVAAGPRFLFVSSFSTGLVTVIDRRTKDVVARVAAGPGPSDIAADGDEAWVANFEGTSLTRVIVHAADPAPSSAKGEGG